MASNNVVKVTPGKGYTLTGKAGAAVQCVRDGKVYVPASLTKEGQVGFTAPCAEVEVVGDGFITENFRSAALALGSGGGDGGGGGSGDCLVVASNDFPKGTIERGAETLTLGGAVNGDCALAIGSYSEAYGISSIAIGDCVYASDDYCLAIGTGSCAGANSALAIHGTAHAPYSIAIGTAAETTGEEGVAIGKDAKVNKDGSIALGTACKANGFLSMAIGYGNTAAGDSCFCVGEGAQVNKENSFAIGKSAVASNYNCGVLGEEATSYSDCTLLLGAKHRAGNVAVTLELMANDLESVAAGSHEGGLKGDTVAFKGGALRFSLVDKLAGKRLCATVTMAQLFDLLCHIVGGTKLEFGTGGYYY